MELKEKDGMPFEAEEYLHLIPERHRSNVGQDAYVRGMVEELSEKPELAELYRNTFLYRNQRLLAEKTEGQIRQLQELYNQKLQLEPIEEYTYDNILAETEKRTRNEDRKLEWQRKLQSFERFIESMSVIKGGTKDFDATSGIFWSSDVTDPDNAHSHSYDAPVLAHRYTYCSFDDITHPQAIGQSDTGNVRVIDDADLQGRAEILTMDIADLAITAHRKGRGLMQTLMDNTFDYQGGKAVLALYCALIFTDVHEAQEFFRQNCGRAAADSWFRSSEYVAWCQRTFDASDVYGRHRTELSFLRDADGDSMAQVKDPSNRLFAIQSSMIEVYEQTGIVPPLELEVRVPTFAKVKPSGTFHEWLDDFRRAQEGRRRRRGAD